MGAACWHRTHTTTSHASYAATNQTINQPHTTTALACCIRLQQHEPAKVAAACHPARGLQAGAPGACYCAANTQHRASCQDATCIDVGAAGVQQGTHRVGCETKHPPNSRALVTSAAVYVGTCPGCTEATHCQACPSGGEVWAQAVGQEWTRHGSTKAKSCNSSQSARPITVPPAMLYTASAAMSRSSSCGC